MSKLSIQLVTWNGAKYIPYLFQSLRNQTYYDWELLVWDNHSTDDTVARIREATADFPVPVTIIEHTDNIGFAPAHNKLYQKSSSEFIVLQNQDMYLSSACLAELIVGMERHPEAGSVTPRLMRWNFAVAQEKGIENSLSNDIDAIGLKIFRNRRVIENFTKQSWDRVRTKLPADELEVFGVSGAFPLYRRSALESVAFADCTFFDETYTSYKEDVDVAYRLQAAAYKAYVLLGSVAYHDRQGAGAEGLSDQAAAKNKQSQSAYVIFHSYKNHLMTLYKNEYWQNFILDFPWILWYELKKLVYFLVFDRRVLSGLKEVFNKDLAKKRRLIKSFRKISWQEMRKWWV